MKVVKLEIPTTGQDALIVFVCISLVGAFLTAFCGAKILSALFYGIGVGIVATAVALLGDRQTS